MPHSSGISRAVRKRGCGASNPARPAKTCSRPLRTSSAACRRSTWATGRTASRPASCRTRNRPSEGRRAQHRRDRARLVDRQGVHARLERHRSPQTDSERLRPAVRRARAVDGRIPDPRSEDQHRDVPSRAGAGSEHADDEEHAAVAAVAVLGQRGDLGQQGQRAQPDARRARPRLVHGRRARAGQRPRRTAREGADHPSAKLFPLPRSGRQLSLYDPKTKKYTFIDTCYSTHHLQFAEDANDTLWTSGGGPVVGWLNTKMFDETGDAARSQGWTALDSRHERQRQARRVHRARPARRSGERHARELAASTPSCRIPPTARSGARRSAIPGAVVRLDPGANPPATALAEVFTCRCPGYGMRGADIDRNGVVWVSMGSGHLGSFDRSKCKGAAERPEGDRRSLSRRLELPSLSGSGLRRPARRERRVELLQLGRPAQHVGPRREHADVDGESLRRRARARER